MLLKGLEGIYYIAFVVLTVLLVKYAMKTYGLQSKKVSELYCKVNILEETNGGNNFAIEIYNYGNAIAKNIKMAIESSEAITIDFIKPGESYIFPAGSILRTVENNRVILTAGDEIIQGETIKLSLYQNDKRFEYALNTDVLFIKRSPSIIHSISRHLGDMSYAERTIMYRAKR